MLMDILKEFPESETVSIMIPASKEEVEMLLEILMGRKVVTHEKEVSVVLMSSKYSISCLVMTKKLR